MSRYDRPVWQIKTCGRFFDEVKDWDAEIRTMTTGLTKEEAASEYAKYYWQGPAAPSMENIEASERGNQLPASDVFLPEDFAREMASGRADRIRSGYRVCEDGTAFAVARIRGEGITDEMVQYFCENFDPEGDLYYKIWCPGVHMRHYNDGAIEDVGGGMEAIRFLAFFGPKELGFTEDGDPKCITVSGGNGVSWPLHAIGKDPRKVFSIRYTREIDGGRESIMFYWHGLHFIDGKGVRVIPEDETISENAVRSQISHCSYEQATEFQVIRAFWQDRLKTS